MRAGTENVYGIVGFAKALELAMANHERDSDYIQGLKTYMIAQLRKTIPGVVFNGDQHAVIGAPQHEIPRRAVPEPREQANHEDVEQRARQAVPVAPAAVAFKRTGSGMVSAIAYASGAVSI